MTFQADVPDRSPGKDTRMPLGGATEEPMYDWLRDLFPICRSITGEGVRRTLEYLCGLIPGMTIHGMPTGSRVFDWVVPEEWNIQEAWIADEAGNRLVDFAVHNLHLMSYSEPVDRWMTFPELDAHLYHLPENPDAIPYVTSYYKRNWGFCVTEHQYHDLKARGGRFHVVVRSRFSQGELNYGELILPGREADREVLLSTYVCHPSMANNELSGPVVVAALARWLQKLENRRYTYRIVFVPETIGPLVYLRRHLEVMRANTVAGFVVTCVGDTRAWSLLESRLGNTLADRLAHHALKHYTSGYKTYSFLHRGSDERQYCAPGVDMPVVSIMRSKYNTYPEYHTSLDDLKLVSQQGLAEAAALYKKCLEILESNVTYRATTIGEPQLGRHGLYPTTSTTDTLSQVAFTRNVLAYSDGSHDLLAMAERLGVDALECAKMAARLANAGLLSIEG